MKYATVDAMHKLAAAFAIALALIFAAPTSGHGAVLSFDVISPNRIGPGNATYLFTGTVTNGTGIDALASELFFDFTGFDASVVRPTQLLGSPDFSIPTGTSSPVIEVFNLSLGPSAVPGQTYSMDVLLQDAAGNLSDTVTVSVHVVPEPSAALLLLAGALFAALTLRHRRRG